MGGSRTSAARPVRNGGRPRHGGDAPQRSTLTRRRVVDAAIELIDADGIAALTMRRLGSALGVEAMALYHWVSGRDELLGAVVDQVIDDLHADPELQRGDDDWRDYLRRIAHSVRRIAKVHPQVFPLIATRPPEAPWVRPPLRSLGWMESFLQALADCGFPDEDAVVAYRAFSSFLLGHLLVEVAAKGADIGPVAGADLPPEDHADLADHPKLASVRALLAQDRADEEFEAALESLLVRLAPLDPEAG